MKIGKIHNPFVVLKQDKSESMTKTGLIIPENALDKKNSGVIVAKQDTFAFEVGDRILFQSQAASPISIDGEELIIVREADVYCSLLNE